MSISKYKNKKGEFYCVRFRVNENGKEVHKNLRGFKTKKDALNAEYEYKRENKLKQPVTESDVEDITMQELFERYIIYARTAIAPTSLYDYNKIARRYILPVFGERKLRTITKRELSDWQDGFPAEFSYKYKRQLRITMSVLYAYAVEKEYVPENVMSKVKGIPNPNAPAAWDYWTYDEFQQFIAVVDNIRWKAVFLFLYLSRCRKGEMFALTWTDVDFERQLINIDKTYSVRADAAVRQLKAQPKTGTKNRKSAKIYMPASMMTLLKQLPHYDYVFGGEKGNRLAAQTLDTAFAEYVALSGVKKIRIHDLRHSCAALIISQSDSELTALYAIAERLRDTPGQILKTYGHLFPSRQRELNQKLDVLFPQKLGT